MKKEPHLTFTAPLYARRRHNKTLQYIPDTNYNVIQNDLVAGFDVQPSINVGRSALVLGGLGLVLLEKRSRTLGVRVLEPDSAALRTPGAPLGGE